MFLNRIQDSHHRGKPIREIQPFPTYNTSAHDIENRQANISKVFIKKHVIRLMDLEKLWKKEEIAHNEHFVFFVTMVSNVV